MVLSFSENFAQTSKGSEMKNQASRATQFGRSQNRVRSLKFPFKGDYPKLTLLKEKIYILSVGAVGDGRLSITDLYREKVAFIYIINSGC